MSLGSKILLSTLGNAVGTSKLNSGIVLVSACSIDPSRIASIIPRVSLIEIRLPEPFQPVFTKYASAPHASIRFTNCCAY